MHFIVLFGPPAVGKMSVGDEITNLTGMPLFHNHLSIEPVLRFFPFGSAPFARIVGEFRRLILEEASRSELPGLIFTYVWALDLASDATYLQNICRIFEDAGADISLVELKADLAQRLARNKQSSRLAAKPSKRDTAASEQRLLEHERVYQMNSTGTLPLPYRHIVVDNTSLPAAAAARQIVTTLALPIQ
ncbi:MAG: hypothetical protein O2780_18920 [Proteobacteria bacterium]|jgi:hypothetical protein|nr:hypothetical protein [Pseudomonadota bacterium]